MNLQSAMGHYNATFKDSRKVLFIIYPEDQTGSLPSGFGHDNSEKVVPSGNEE